MSSPTVQVPWKKIKIICYIYLNWNKIQYKFLINTIYILDHRSKYFLFYKLYQLDMFKYIQDWGPFNMCGFLVFSTKDEERTSHLNGRYCSSPLTRPYFRFTDIVKWYQIVPLKRGPLIRLFFFIIKEVALQESDWLLYLILKRLLE